uniref:AAA+ ATPase domain-containing protein n=1 Tax=viral metagenome TaxID=1070528 RepID=A0A6C0KLW0_9ZZZZ
MENININNLLNRDEEANKIKEILKDFEKNKHNLSFKKGIYIYGDPGSGKSTFIQNILKEMDYDIIKYDAGDIRNKSIIDTITKHNMSDKNIMSMFLKKIKRIAIIMDEIDGMNNGDKGGINSLIKIIRPKKTKKQRLEEITLNPIICVGNYHIDKKIKELMKVCHVIELKSPTKQQMTNILNKIVPTIEENIKINIINFIQGDLRKLETIYELYKNKQNILNNNIIKNIFLMKSYNDDTRKITQKLINNNFPIDDHLTIMNETDRTIVGLLWHENIIDVLGKMEKENSIPFYLKILDNICFADYIDRITFQKQIWQFNEMSSLIKTFKNNKIYHETFSFNEIKNESNKKQKFSPSEVRFTKVLTKYSTEYNNTIFIQNLCQELSMDKNDMFAFFLDLKNKNSDNDIFLLFENYDISKLDINRIYRYLDKYIKENAAETEDIIFSDEEI